MTNTPAAARPHCADPHDHTGHDHPPTGAELVRDLVKGLSIQALLIPALAVVMLIAILPLAPTTPLPLLVGVVLGGVQLALLVGTSMIVSRRRAQMAMNPGLAAVRSVLDEVLRVGAVLLAVLLWPADIRTELGVWIGAGCALVWLILATAQTVATRRRISRPGDWSKEAISTLLAHRVGARDTVVMRLLDVVGMIAFQIGATVLVILSPILAAGTAVLSLGSALATLVLQRRSPAERSRSPWAYAPLLLGLLTLLLAVLASVIP